MGRYTGLKCDGCGENYADGETIVHTLSMWEEVVHINAPLNEPEKWELCDRCASKVQHVLDIQPTS